MECLGSYQEQGECRWCSLALLCLNITEELDQYYDELADKQREIEEMEEDANWKPWM